MKKILMTLVLVAVAFTFVGAAYSSDSTTTRDSGKIKTADGNIKFKTKTVDHGQFTTEKGTIVKTDNVGPVRIEKAKFKSFSVLDQHNYHNTITVIKDKKEFLRHTDKNWKLNKVGKTKTTQTDMIADGDKVMLYYTLDPKTMSWELVHMEKDK